MATKLVTLLGTPLSQSFAARMQNEAYASIGFDAHYFYTETDNSLVGNNIALIRKDPSFVGFAVTKPNKEYAVQFMDELDPMAQKMGAINTVVRNADGTLKGYNTDGYGAGVSLELEGVDIQNSIFFAWGAGGAGRAVCFTVVDKGCKKIYIADVRENTLAQDLNEKFGREVAVNVDARDMNAVLAGVAEANVLMNLSGLGMRGHEDQTVIDQKYIRPDHICFDATYNPTKTRFLKEAEAKGCHIISGLDMSIYQGARQIELWTGQAAPVETMKATIRDIINGK